MGYLVTLFNNLIWDYQQAVGTGWYVILWILSLMYCVWGPEKRMDRLRFVVPVMTVVFIIICPISAIILMKILDVSTYSRFAWCLLVLPIIAYVMTDISRRTQGKRKIVCFLLAVVVIICSGSWIYTSENFVKAENVYKLSDQTIEISDYLVNNCKDEIVYTDESLTCEIRQYTAFVKLLYGRTGGGPGEGINTKYARSTEEEFAVYLNQIVDKGCSIVVLSVSVPDAQVVFEKNGWECIWTNGEYNVFRYIGSDR